jgi:ribosomal protein L3 glutamine methyltransferase
MTARPATLGGWLRQAERRYREAGVALGQVAADAHDEALYLILRTLRLPLESGPEILSRRLTARESTAVESALHRRLVDRVPAAYLTGEAWLGGLRFHCDERALIPRSYFVEIITGQLDAWLPDPSRVRRVADVCTGSGCLAILLARHFPKARVDGLELSAAALEVAALNVRRHRLGARVRLIESDVFDAVPRARYDVIVSNPPYEPTARVDALPAEFQREPRLALDGGADGLAIIRKLLRQAGPRLTAHGVLLIEVGGLRAAIDREFAALEPHWLSTADGADCVCIINAARLAAPPQPGSCSLRVKIGQDAEPDRAEESRGLPKGRSSG